MHQPWKCRWNSSSLDVAWLVGSRLHGGRRVGRGGKRGEKVGRGVNVGVHGRYTLSIFHIEFLYFESR
jgi:hypothetical protein